MKHKRTKQKAINLPLQFPDWLDYWFCPLLRLLTCGFQDKKARAGVRALSFPKRLPTSHRSSLPFPSWLVELTTNGSDAELTQYEKPRPKVTSRVLLRSSRAA